MKLTAAPSSERTAQGTLDPGLEIYARVQQTTRLRPWRLAFAAALAIAILVIFWRDRTPLENWVDHVVAVCRQAGPWAYFGAMAILPMFGFSLFAFVASAGPVFTPVLGISHVIAYGVLALAVNVTLSYVLARWAFRPVAQRIVAWFGCPLPDASRSAGWEIGFIVRLIPGPPFGLQSCVLGVANLRFVPYFATSLLVPSLYLAGTVLLESGIQGKNLWGAAVAALFLTLTGAACHRLRRRLGLRFRPVAATVPSQG